MYCVLFREKETETIALRFIPVLNKGYTFTDIKRSIIDSFKSGNPFPWNMFSRKRQGNIDDYNMLVHGTRYYHKNLILLPPPPVSVVDYESGEITSQPVEFFVEPVASYTIGEAIDYFYKKVDVNQKQFDRKRIGSYFTTQIKKYGIDKLLFMIEAASFHVREGEKFTMNTFADMITTANEYYNSARSNAISANGSEKYVCKRRVLPD